MQYINDNQWVHGTPCRAAHDASVQADFTLQVEPQVVEHHHGCEHCHEDHEHHNACDCFCDEFCSRFCELFCRDFCSEVRDEIHEEPCEKKHKKCKCKCKKRIKLETCRQVACRTCARVFVEMGRVCPSNFCFCFAEDFCREFCEAFKVVRHRLCEHHHNRRDICHCGCREICEAVCPRACRQNCCRIPIM